MDTLPRFSSPLLRTPASTCVYYLTHPGAKKGAILLLALAVVVGVVVGVRTVLTSTKEEADKKVENVYDHVRDADEARAQLTDAIRDILDKDSALTSTLEGAPEFESMATCQGVHAQLEATVNQARGLSGIELEPYQHALKEIDSYAHTIATCQEDIAQAVKAAEEARAAAEAAAQAQAEAEAQARAAAQAQAEAQAQQQAAQQATPKQKPTQPKTTTQQRSSTSTATPSQAPAAPAPQTPASSNGGSASGSRSTRITVTCDRPSQIRVSGSGGISANGRSIASGMVVSGTTFSLSGGQSLSWAWVSGGNCH